MISLIEVSDFEGEFLLVRAVDEDGTAHQARFSDYSRGVVFALGVADLFDVACNIDPKLPWTGKFAGDLE